MTEAGKWMMLAAAFLGVVGIMVWGLGRLGFRGLPGDIRYESENLRVYVPIVTCLVLSVLLTAVSWLWQWWRR